MAELKINCDKCGSELTYQPGTETLACDYCGNTVQIPSIIQKPSDIVETDFIVPIQIQPEALTSATQAYMITGHYTPDDLVQKAVITKQWLKYVPFYRFDGSYHANWTATFGYDRQEHYTAYETVNRNGHSFKEPVTKTKTVTDWRPVSGSVNGLFNFLGYGGNDLDAKAIALLEEQNISGLAPYDFKFVAGFVVDKYSLSTAASYDAFVRSKVNQLIERDVKRNAQGDRQRDWNWSGKNNYSTDTIMIPVAHSVFEYEGKEYNVWVDGVNPSRVAGDELPVDTKKKNAAHIGFLPLAITLGIVVVLYLQFHNHVFSWWVVFAILLSVSYGLIRRHLMISHSKQVRQALLTQVQAADTDTSNASEETLDEIAKSYQAVAKPFLADTSNDKFVLPAVSVVAILLAAVPVFNSYRSESNFDQPKLTAEPLIQQTQNETLTQEKNESVQVPSNDSAKPNLEERQVKIDQPTPAATSKPMSQNKIENAFAPIPVAEATPYLKTMIESMAQGNQTGLENAYASIMQLPKPAKGDRKLAREINNEGLAYFKEHKYADAVDKFISAVNLDPSDQEIVNNLGFALQKDNRLQESTYALSAALTINPGRSGAWFNLGENLALQGNTNGAVAAMRIGYKYSKNQQKTKDYWMQQASNPSTDSKVAKAINLAIQSIGN